ncbi:MAG: hypothetical protein IPL26_19835 [Leptospiraceae bacterium]|nr:hypothetical protein [Leptospiraceae bacterium]
MQAINMGLISEQEVSLLPTRSTIDRWLKDAGLNRTSYSRVLASRSWDIEAPNVLWMTDASPANRIYISKSGLVTRPDIDPSDKHLDEILHRDNLRKVHIYIAVDVYSGAWFARAFASDPIGANSKRTGENSVDFRSMLIEAMLPKYNGYNPFEGVPQILYSDKGSAFKPLGPFFDKLEIEYMHHFPNNPKAKGFAEGGISRIKRSIETCMSAYTVKTIDDFNIVLQNHMVHNNQAHGHYDLFLQGCKQSPIKRITQKNISDAISRELERVVDAYGCVSVNKKLLGVDMELVGVKVKLLERNNVWIAKDPDGNIYECDPNGKVKNSIKDFSMYRIDENGKKIPVTDRKNSEKEKRRQRIKDEGKLLARTATIDDILYPESNLRHFPPANFTKDTHSTLAPEEFDSVEQALTYILTETGLTVNEIPHALFTQIKSSLELMGAHEKITSTYVYKLVNILNKSISRLEAINEK